MRIPWTDAEDAIINLRLEHPTLSLAEIQVALLAIGSNRTIRGIESRAQQLKREAKANKLWLNDPFLTGKKATA
jgi:hypothetical protein